MRTRFIPAFLTVFLLVAGCGKRDKTGSASTEHGTALSTLHLGNEAEPETLDPHLAVKYLEYNVLMALFEGLTVIDEVTSQPRPAMAESWEVSPDQLVYTFHLRPAAWSNGEPVTADDFAFSIERILSPELASQYSYMLYVLKGAEDYNLGKTKSFSDVGVRVIDPRTLELTLARPTPYLLSLTAHQAWFPVNKTTILKFGGAHQRDTKWTRPPNLVGNGPYVLEEWKLNQRIVVTKNPRYWDAAQNKLDRVIFYPIDDAAVEERNFRTGQLDITYRLPMDRVAFYRQQSPSPLRVDPLLATYYLRFNVTRPPFDNLKVRQALARGFDRRAIATSVLQDTMLPAFSFIPPKTAGYTSTAHLDVDFNEARRLLAEAGYEKGHGFPKVEVQYSEPVMETKVVEAIQEMWRRELGIDVSLVLLDNRVHISNQHSLSYQISASGWIGDYNDPSTFTDLMLSQSGNNDTGWKNADYDALLAQASREADTAKRFALLQKAETLMLDEAPVAPVYIATRTYLAKPTVKNWVPALLGIHRYQLIEVQ
jgi:oligopeptide transport system substrate-binding protein